MRDEKKQKLDAARRLTLSTVMLGQRRMGKTEIFKRVVNLLKDFKWNDNQYKGNVMKQSKRVIQILAAGWLAAALSGNALASWEATQTVDLKAGWNAVFLEVLPDDPTPDAVFEGLPVAQVAAYYPRTSTVQFIRSPEETPFNQSGWHVWVPEDAPVAFLNNLYQLQANRSYLIFSNQDFQWDVTGKPEFEPIRWQPDSFNLVGFHVLKDDPPTFKDLLLDDPAFSNALFYALRNGGWVRIGPEDLVESGRAYWVYSKGAPLFNGLMGVSISGGGDELAFPQGAIEQTIEIFNDSDVARQVVLTQLPDPVGGPSLPLALVTDDPETGKTFAPFSSLGPLMVASGETQTIRLALRRADLIGDRVESLLALDIDQVRLWIPAWAE